MLELAVLIVAVLLLSGFFSGAEAALVSLTDAEVGAMGEGKRVGAAVLAAVKRKINRAVIAIVVMNNVVNIVGSIMVGQLVIRIYGNAMLAITTTALTFGVIVFSEIIPKTLGIHYAPRIAPLIAPFILALTVLLLPVILLLELLTNALKRGERHVGTEDQIRSLVTIGRREGHIETDEGQLIHRAFILNDKTAHDVMTPLKAVVGVEQEKTVSDAAHTVLSHTYSRYPIFGSSIHDVIGIAMSKDILEAIAEGKDNEPITSIMREPMVIPARMRCDALLLKFRDAHIHLGIVQEGGKTVGLITLEDVLEELVGEIEDETDVENDS